MEHVDVMIVGAGVIGLAIASEIARQDHEIYVLEKELTYGQGTSSRNSEVIHAGIYYTPDSLKAKLCVKGNAMLYRICEASRLPHKRLGKLIVATKESEVEQLAKLLQQGVDSGAKGLEMIDEVRIHELEPRVRAIAAIHSSSTGIIDAHRLMDYFYRSACKNSGTDPLVLNTEVLDIDQRQDGYVVTTRSNGELFSVKTTVVINAAGLYADRVAGMVGMDIDKERYRISWCKGDYFSFRGAPPVRMLIYPIPPMDQRSLGIHTVPDLTGRLKFGPNAYYTNEISYKVESDLDTFFQDIMSYLPSVKKEDLHPDISGIRAKLQSPGESFRDFIIQHEEDKGFYGLINLIGVESPGLTCAPAIGEMVRDMVDVIV